MKKVEEVKIYRPQHKVIPEWVTNPITDNYTDENGRVYNTNEENILISKQEVDDNHK